jgi:tetratricopeptide (TPR) repeat protein
VEALNNIGYTDFILGKYEEATQVYQRALAVDSDNAVVQTNIAGALIMLGKFEEALPHYTAAVRANRLVVDRFMYAASYLARKGHSEEALSYYAALAEIEPENASLPLQMGKLKLTLQKNTDAVENLEKALLLNPNDPESHYYLGRALFQTGNRQEAFRHFDEAVRLKPDYAEVYLTYSLCEKLIGNDPEAERQLAKANALLFQRKTVQSGGENPLMGKLPQRYKNLFVVP